jgi:hypothetical protein
VVRRTYPAGNTGCSTTTVSTAAGTAPLLS